MELKVVEEKKGKFIFELPGADYGLVGAIRKELWNDEATKAAGYSVEHPLIGVPRFLLETSGEEPRKVLRSAIKRLKKELEKLKDQVKEIK